MGQKGSEKGNDTVASCFAKINQAVKDAGVSRKGRLPWTVREAARRACTLQRAKSSDLKAWQDAVALLRTGKK